MNKKIIIILSIIIILALAIGGIYLIFLKKQIPGASIISNFFPSSNEQPISGIPSMTSGGAGGNVNQQIFSLTQLTKSAVSGAGVSSSTVRYLEKSSGNIYEINPDGQNHQRLTNTTILKTFETFWSADANKLIVRYFGDSNNGYPALQNFSAVIPGTGTTTTALQGIFLPQSIKAVTVSPIEDKIFYLIPLGGNNVGIIAGFDNKKQNNVLTITFGEFQVSWPAKNIIAFLTKPSAGIEGFLYSLDLKTSQFDKIIGGIDGLTALVSPNYDKVIYSQSRNNSIDTKIFDIKSKNTNDFGVATLPEKCIWSKIDKNIVYCAAPSYLPNAQYPDEWYQGLISLKDSFWKINLATGETNFLVQTNSDAINPLLTRDENYLIFTDKNDNTLWSLKLK